MGFSVSIVNDMFILCECLLEPLRKMSKYLIPWLLRFVHARVYWKAIVVQLRCRENVGVRVGSDIVGNARIRCIQNCIVFHGGVPFSKLLFFVYMIFDRFRNPCIYGKPVLNRRIEGLVYETCGQLALMMFENAYLCTQGDCYLFGGKWIVGLGHNCETD